MLYVLQTTTQAVVYILSHSKLSFWFSHQDPKVETVYEKHISKEKEKGHYALESIGDKIFSD